jgi:integrase
MSASLIIEGPIMPTGIYERPPIVADRLRWLEPHVGGFRPWLVRRGYQAVTIVEIVRLLSIWAEWADTAGFDLPSIEAGLAASAAVFRSGKTSRAAYGAAKLFIAWLRVTDVLPPERRAASPEETWPLLAAYSGWMREQRGLAESTLALRQPVIVNLLETLGGDPAAYTAKAVRRFVLERAAPHGRGRAQAIASATRSFLRYLIATGQCPLGLDHAVPGFANWQLAATPRFLSGPDLARVIAACDGETRLRDRAIVLLLARLGLRASEAAHLRFAHIDWTGATVTVSGKVRREERLPLPQDVGDALLAYIERGRPPVATEHLFLTDIAPVVPLSRIAIKCLVRRALDRAGLNSPHRGAHVLRHTAATAMLAGGASLAGVGAVLRHRSPSMTAHYAKVDFGLLSEIAQPWGGRAPC